MKTTPERIEKQENEWEMEECREGERNPCEQKRNSRPPKINTLNAIARTAGASTQTGLASAAKKAQLKQDKD